MNSEYRVVQPIAEHMPFVIVRVRIEADGKPNKAYSIVGPPDGRSIPELKAQLLEMAAALDKPFLDEKDVFYSRRAPGDGVNFPVIGEG